MGRLEMVLGGARSGKSRIAETLGLDSGMSCFYVATATAGDDEMAQRIAHHQCNRNEAWQLIEEPIALAHVIAEHHADDRCLLVDCLTLWLSNCLHADCWPKERSALFDVLERRRGLTILVSNELGMGVVPMGELSRRFVDEAGFLHQDLARISDQVTFAVAGLPLPLKDR